MSKRLFLHATNIHRGGGRSLLEALLKSIPHSDVTVLLDSRMTIPQGISEGIDIRRIKPSIVQRLKAEWWLASHVKPEDVVLCFGNLPPLFKLHGNTLVFVQNRYLIEPVSLKNFALKDRFRLSAERLWLQMRCAHVDAFIVQTYSMQRILEKRLKGRVPVQVAAFVGSHEGYTRSASAPSVRNKPLYDFLYVASGEPHKNHRQLVEALCLLADQGYFPSLCLTLEASVSPDLCAWIRERIERYGLKIDNLGFLSHDQVANLYTQAGALLYPSNFESFGLPLIEARQAGLPILAPELDYVRDVLDPEQSFDPESPLSIARAVKRFMGVNEQPLPLQDAKAFVRGILGRTK